MHLPDALITDKAVYFDGVELPWYISEGGIDFKPGGRDDFNRLRVEFLVDSARFENSWETKHGARWFDLRVEIARAFNDAMLRFKEVGHG